jgi:hypothetical protein
MKKLIYTILELEEWNRNSTCCFCFNKSVCQIRTRSKATHEIIANDEACENCKEKFESYELAKCERCGRLKNRHSIDTKGIYVCRCVRYNENVKEKELPVLPHEEREATFYERQINGLREELNTAEVEIDTHLEALETAEDWHKRQKQELLNRIKELEAENKKLKELTPQGLLDEMNKLKERVKELEQQTAQIEVKEPKK